MTTRFMFAGTDDILGEILDTPPNDRFIDYDAVPRGKIYEGRVVKWAGSPGYNVEIPVENIHFMEGNQWNFGHAAALLAGIKSGQLEVLEVPAGRVYRIKASDVKSSEAWAKKGQLEEQLGMNTPWTKRDIGSYYAQLLDGNHRAAAAMLAREPSIVVRVGENYRENVYKKDMI